MTPRRSARSVDAPTASDEIAPNAVALQARVLERSRRLRTRRARRLSGLVLVLSLGLYGIASGAPPASAQSGSFTFTGSGWGHGVGMSQWGARGMAAAGGNYGDILRHYYTGTAVGPSATSNDLQILLAQRTGTFTVTTGGTTTVNGVGTVGGGQTIVATRNGNDVVLSGALSASVATFVDVPVWNASAPVALSPPGYSYRYGTLRISIDGGGGLRAVIWGLPMQQYLYGLGEMPSSWPVEALKAQATASRTYAQKKRNLRSSDFDLYGSMLDQAYTGTKFEVPAWTAAVDATNDQVVTYGGQLIDAVYSASSGGHTEHSEYVWVASVPYLRGVTDPFDGNGGNPNASWSRTYSGAELGGWFGLGTVTSVQVLGARGVSGRVDKATIRLTGTNGSADVGGASFRSTVNARLASGRQLMSTKFVVDGASAPSAPPAPPANTMVSGAITVATSDGRTVIIGGNSVDPDGWPLVRVVSTMGNERAVRDYRSSNGKFLLAWTGSPGTRNVCVTVYDEPTGQGVSLGCRDIVVK